MAVLKVIRGPAAQPEYTICSDRTVLGRDRSCGIWIKRHEVSRQHVAFVRTADGYGITDCGSHNGTILNGQRLVAHEHHPLDDRDLIQVGTFVFSFQYDSADVWFSEESSDITPEQFASERVLSPASQKAVDADCDRFEASWQVGRVPRIEDYLEAWQGPQHVEQRRTLLHELVLIDVEYRWRRGSPISDTETSEADVDVPPAENAGLCRLPLRPLLEDYLDHYPELECDGYKQMQLITTEYRVRQQWGDRPRYPDYRDRFPRVDDSLETTLRKTALRLSPTMVRIYRQQELVFSREYASPLEIGRQKVGEPSPYGFVPSEGMDRIIIAPAHDHMVSRSQLFLEIVARKGFLIQNRSKKSNLFLQSGEKLPPGEIRFGDTPVLVSVGEIAVRLAAR